MTRRSYDALLERFEELSAHPNVSMEKIGEFDAMGRTYPLFMLHIGELGPGKVKVMLASGIHGDEPAGVEAALRFVRESRGNKSLLERFYFTVFPCNNPTGWEADTRENWRGVDINREFAVRKPEPEAEIIMRALQGRCFDLVFEMHEDIDSPGFYLYEITDNPAEYVGEEIISAVAAAGFPINNGDMIEGMPARGGLIRRSIKRFRKTRLPQAIYTYRTCGGHVITVEPPASRLSLEDRIWIELTGLEIALDAADRVAIERK